MKTNETTMIKIYSNKSIIIIHGSYIEYPFKIKNYNEMKS